MTSQHQWGYTGSCGPSRWAEIAPAAGGQRQSPIAIRAAEAQFSPTLRDRPLVVSYNPAAVNKLVNNGQSLQVCVDGNDSTLRGGPLGDDKYVLIQFHFHWGSVSSRGSEHKIDDVTYAAELHMVHWNATRFTSFNDAVKSDNGICVLTVFIAAGSEHVSFSKLCGLMPSVKYSGQTAKIPDGFQPTDLLPENTELYWTYEGSLTTPPCYESVRFVIFKNPIQVSERQLDALRSLQSCERASGECHCPLVDNFRPTMPLNGRVVLATFRKFFA